MNPTNENAIAPTATTSKEVRRMLGLSLHCWENAMVVFLIVAGFFALIAGAATWAVVRLQRIELAESKNEFDEYKLTAEGKVADAKKEGIEAGKTAGNALARAAGLEKEAAELRAANLALEAQIAPRDLNEDQRKTVINTLKPFAGRRVTVQSFSMDTESMRLGYEIMLALDGAGIQFFDNRGSVMIAGPNLRFGIEVSNPNTEEGQQFGLSIAAAIMTASEGKIAVRHLAVAHTSDVIVFVGTKPIAGIK